MPGETSGIAVLDADHIAVSEPDGGVLVYRHFSDAGYSAPAKYAAGENPSCLEAADLTGDGLKDLAVCNATGGTFTLLRGLADGGFASAEAFGTTGARPYALTFADFDHDGLLDVAAAHRQNLGSVSVMLATDAGTTFLPARAYDAQSLAIDITSGDFDHDGNPDIIVSNENLLSSAVSWLRGTGDGGFLPFLRLDGAGRTTVCVAGGDFNADGLLDIVAGNQQSTKLSVFLGGCP